MFDGQKLQIEKNFLAKIIAQRNVDTILDWSVNIAMCCDTFCMKHFIQHEQECPEAHLDYSVYVFDTEQHFIVFMLVDSDV